MFGRPERAFFFTFSSKEKINFYNDEDSADKIKKFKLFYENRNKIDT